MPISEEDINLNDTPLWKGFMRRVAVLWQTGCFLLLSACAFDVVRIEQEPAYLLPNTSLATPFTLSAEVTVNLSTGYARRLNAGTVWQPTGRLSQGQVYATKDQILTVEGSNIHEAHIVVDGERMVGFYLPAKGTFSPLIPPVLLELVSAGQSPSATPKGR